jgi:hypothetical protein
MNYIERFVDRRIKRLAWKSTTLGNVFSYKEVENAIDRYRWIIKDNDNQVIYDTESNGYEGLNDFPAVIEALELIKDVEKKEVKRKKVIDKPEIIFTLDSQLWSIFPYEKLEKICISWCVY